MRFSTTPDDRNPIDESISGNGNVPSWEVSTREEKDLGNDSDGILMEVHGTVEAMISSLQLMAEWGETYTVKRTNKSIV